MATGHLYVTRDLGPEPMELLRNSGHELVVHPDRDLPPTREALLDGVSGAAGIITLLTEKMDAALFDHAGPQLQVVSAVSVGTDNIDVGAASSRGITVTNTPDVLTDATADLAMGLLLALNRRIVQADAFLRRGEAWSWGPRLFLGRDLAGEVLGIVGYGRIGEALARRARAFGMRVIAAGSDQAHNSGVERMPLPQLLRTADVVSLHAPLTERTRHLLGTEELAAMKQGAIIINTARGPLIDEDALVEALRRGKIRGAGLDVFEYEPKIHPGLLELDSVVLTPHIGSAGEQTRTRMAMLALENALAVLDGQSPPTPVNEKSRPAVTVPPVGVGEKGDV
ncbi:lactate dehydrogenase-like 2-hydroxyacid dehydrogenase [Arthrobacter pigmenti]|uniref:Lactate dehydrogenase-like 2-hydroxyacid dehydrogenase n=1 Tax=Arthrobacter pigmenti TaxID=271432 RepID=A0A846RMX9_9MICC|nr:D-glycerate dehydrogenase [Arthrobacter pigmenti]NJC21487.1 lactate dehydrogenase-like 2-hydroxyacid dehydrogenase [Arthrobacter pigmenti]